jgi:HAE1 family hydrophobic/amphiphilic exporter-1
MQTTYAGVYSASTVTGRQINGILRPATAQPGNAGVEEVFAQTMPREMGYNYAGMSFQEKAAAEGVPASAIFGFAALRV